MARKKSSLFLWVVVLAAMGGGGYYYYFRGGKAAAKPLQYRSASVAKGDVVQAVTANGQLSPVVLVQVGSQVSGNVLKLYADFNSKVTNGQLVAELDPATYTARLIQAESELANAMAQRTLARVNARRAEELLKASLIARADYDQTMAELEQREATVKIREAALNSTQVDVSRTKIYSPIDGTVISRNVDVGQTVQASFTAPTLFNIANDLSKMEIGAMVSEADIGEVAEGQEVTFTVEAFPSRTFGGRVSQVRNQPTTNQNVVTYATIIEVRNPELKLKPGMTANVSIITAKKQGVVKVPNGAFRFRPPETAVVISNTAPAAVAAAGGGGAGGSPSNASATASAPAGSGGGGGGRGGRGMPPELLARFDKNGDGQLDDAERQAMRAERGSRGGGGGGGGFGGGFGGDGGGRQRADAAPVSRTLYLLSTNLAKGPDAIELKQVRVKTGISDGASTEVVEGLKEGDVVALTVVAAPGTGAAPGGAGGAPAANPFGGGPFGGGGRRF